jgi:hypothetical protein
MGKGRYCIALYVQWHGKLAAWPGGGAEGSAGSRPGRGSADSTRSAVGAGVSATGVQEVARLRAEVAQEVAAMQKIQAAHRSRVVLDIGGVRHVTSVATSRPDTMLDAIFSGRRLIFLLF